ncbi:hypothetical protein [Algicola sagamiensis]|uniref:hypothetical protein n=1 Tax=Algicola sagamiensis TaxID=163869 RepID=UPI0003809CED|nr:hypothetical protein [Algicola sagamiensis]
MEFLTLLWIFCWGVFSLLCSNWIYRANRDKQNSDTNVLNDLPNVSKLHEKYDLSISYLYRSKKIMTDIQEYRVKTGLSYSQNEIDEFIEEFLIDLENDWELLQREPSNLSKVKVKSTSSIIESELERSNR